MRYLRLKLIRILKMKTILDKVQKQIVHQISYQVWNNDFACSDHIYRQVSSQVYNQLNKVSDPISIEIRNHVWKK